MWLITTFHLFSWFYDESTILMSICIFVVCATKKKEGHHHLLFSHDNYSNFQFPFSHRPMLPKSEPRPKTDRWQFIVWSRTSSLRIATALLSHFFHFWNLHTSIEAQLSFIFFPTNINIIPNFIATKFVFCNDFNELWLLKLHDFYQLRNTNFTNCTNNYCNH